MQIVVIADGIKQMEFQDKQIPAGVQVQFVTTAGEIKTNAEAYFYLLDEENLPTDIEQLRTIAAPVFVNAVITTLKDLPANCTRLTAWPGFLLHEAVEICASPENVETAVQVLKRLNWKYHQVPDIAGMIAPRTIALLVNEAYGILTVDENSKSEIECAMKMGTNFNYGPFELAEKIGLGKIYNLLMHLAQTNNRYTPEPIIKKEIDKVGINT